MAKIMLVGEWSQVELKHTDDGQVLAVCRQHRRKRCDWREEYGDLRNASEYAADHADRP